ncbi:MAG TPA: hypothetical protein VFQ87_07425, partial [Bradyrhizobium sp.]|nr:hypothetical protein [Bradyrhizobium sp.]
MTVLLLCWPRYRHSESVSESRAETERWRAVRPESLRTMAKSGMVPMLGAAASVAHPTYPYP